MPHSRILSFHEVPILRKQIGKADFSGTVFHRTAIYNDAVFHKQVSFKKARMLYAQFFGTKFLAEATFHNASAKAIQILKGEFHRPATFNLLDGELSIAKTWFNSPPRFPQDGNVAVRDCKVKDQLLTR
jgi:hypothetical protein